MSNSSSNLDNQAQTSWFGDVTSQEWRDAPEVADLHVAIGGSEGEGQPVALLQTVEGGGKAGEARPSQLVGFIGGLHQCCSCQILRAIQTAAFIPTEQPIPDYDVDECHSNQICYYTEWFHVFSNELSIQKPNQYLGGSHVHSLLRDRQVLPACFMKGLVRGSTDRIY